MFLSTIHILKHLEMSFNLQCDVYSIIDHLTPFRFVWVYNAGSKKVPDFLHNSSSNGGGDQI